MIKSSKTFGGTGYNIDSAIAVDALGGIDVVGTYSGTVDFDPDPLATYNLTAPGASGNGFHLKLWTL